MPDPKRPILDDPKNPPMAAPVKDAKTADPDLRHRLCENGPCKKEPEPEPLAHKQPEDPELRRRVCLNGKCNECGTGPLDKKCPSETPQNNNVNQACQPYESWNGGGCTSRCSAAETWNGFSCSNMAECAGVNARAAALADEIRAAKGGMKRECSADPDSTECTAAKAVYDDAIMRYRALIGGTTSLTCRTALGDPMTI